MVLSTVRGALVEQDSLSFHQTLLRDQAVAILTSPIKLDRKKQTIAKRLVNIEDKFLMNADAICKDFVEELLLDTHAYVAETQPTQLSRQCDYQEVRDYNLTRLLFAEQLEVNIVNKQSDEYRAEIEAEYKRLKKIGSEQLMASLRNKLATFKRLHKTTTLEDYDELNLFKVLTNLGGPSEEIISPRKAKNPMIPNENSITSSAGGPGGVTDNLTTGNFSNRGRSLGPGSRRVRDNAYNTDSAMSGTDVPNGAAGGYVSAASGKRRRVQTERAAEASKTTVLSGNGGPNSFLLSAKLEEQMRQDNYTLNVLLFGKSYADMVSASFGGFVVHGSATGSNSKPSSNRQKCKNSLTALDPLLKPEEINADLQILESGFPGQFSFIQLDKVNSQMPQKKMR